MDRRHDRHVGLQHLRRILKQIKAQVDDEVIYNFTYQEASLADPAYVVELFDKLWNKSDLRVQDLKADGQLAFFVTSDLCHLYEKYLDSRAPTPPTPTR